MKVFTTVALLIVMIFIGHIEAAAVKKGEVHKAAKASLKGKKQKKKSKKLATKTTTPTPRKLQQFKLNLFEQFSNMIDMLIVLIIVMYLWSFMSTLFTKPANTATNAQGGAPKKQKRKLKGGEKKKADKDSESEPKKELAFETTVDSRLKPIRKSEILDLPMNHDLPKFVRRLKNDIFRILDQHYKKEGVTPNIDSSLAALGPYLSQNFYYKSDGFAKLKARTVKFMEYVRDHPDKVPGF